MHYLFFSMSVLFMRSRVDVNSNSGPMGSPVMALVSRLAVRMRRVSILPCRCTDYGSWAAECRVVNWPALLH